MLEPQASPELRSVYAEAAEEVRRYQQARSSRGDPAVLRRAALDWNERHWPSFLRDRYIHHLSGDRAYREFSSTLFGIAKDLSSEKRRLWREIIEQLRQGAENLNILCWAWERHEDIERVQQILYLLDINSVRFLPPQVEAEAEAKAE